MTGTHLEFIITDQAKDNEIIIAALDQLPVDSIWEDNDLKFYISASRFDDELKARLDLLAEHWAFSYECQTLPDINWNAKWEAGFSSVEVGDFCRVRASFHEPRQGDFTHEIVVDPKMAFGTGHHETTFMMIQWLEQLDINELKVWDYGTGTGILAILCKMMGSGPTQANDIESIAIENAIHNAELNGTTGIDFVVGDASVVPDSNFDLILANINRNVLLETMTTMASKLTKNGVLLISGILKSDRPIMEKALLASGLIIRGELIRGEWMALKCGLEAIDH